MGQAFTRTEYRAKHQALRQAINAQLHPGSPEYPTPALRRQQHEAGRSQALAQLRALTGNVQRRETPRQAQIRFHIAEMARRADRRAALAALRDAGADAATLDLAGYHLRVGFKTPEQVRRQAARLADAIAAEQMLVRRERAAA